MGSLVTLGSQSDEDAWLTNSEALKVPLWCGRGYHPAEKPNTVHEATIVADREVQNTVGVDILLRITGVRLPILVPCSANMNGKAIGIRNRERLLAFCLLDRIKTRYPKPRPRLVATNGLTDTINRSVRRVEHLGHRPRPQQQPGKVEGELPRLLARDRRRDTGAATRRESQAHGQHGQHQHRRMNDDCPKSTHRSPFIWISLRRPPTHDLFKGGFTGEP